jgi:hypothetical protein
MRTASTAKTICATYRIGIVAKSDQTANSPPRKQKLRKSLRSYYAITTHLFHTSKLSSVCGMTQDESAKRYDGMTRQQIADCDRLMISIGSSSMANCASLSYDALPIILPHSSASQSCGHGTHMNGHTRRRYQRYPRRQYHTQRGRKIPAPRERKSTYPQNLQYQTRIAATSLSRPEWRRNDHQYPGYRLGSLSHLTRQ